MIALAFVNGRVWYVLPTPSSLLFLFVMYLFRIVFIILCFILILFLLFFFFLPEILRVFVLVPPLFLPVVLDFLFIGNKTISQNGGSKSFQLTHGDLSMAPFRYFTCSFPAFPSSLSPLPFPSLFFFPLSFIENRNLDYDLFFFFIKIIIIPNAKISLK